MCVITNTHLASHGLTTTQYREQFGELSKRLVSLKTAEALLPFGLGKYPDSIVSERSGVSRRDVALARARLSLPVVAGLYRTQEGVSCRSIVEAQFDAWLHDCDIDHVHQPGVPNTKRFADFQVGRIYIEIIGMGGFSRYESRWSKKKSEYEAADVPWIGFYPDQVEHLYSLSSTKVICVERRCSECKTLLIHSLDGMCRKCHRRAWGKKNSTMTICEECGIEYPKSPGSPLQKYCGRKCYSKSLRLELLPSDEEIVEALKGTNTNRLAIKLGVHPSTIYQRLARMKKRAA